MSNLMILQTAQQKRILLERILPVPQSISIHLMDINQYQKIIIFVYNNAKR